MRRLIRAGSLALVAAVALTGCTLLSSARPMAERVLEVPSGEANAVVDVVTARLEAASMAQVSTSVDGNRVTVRFETDSIGVSDDLFTMPGELAVRPLVIVSDAVLPACADVGPTEQCQATSDGEVLTFAASGLSNADIDDVRAAADQSGGWAVELDLTDAGSAAMEELSGELACVDDQYFKRFGVLLDGEVLTAPTLMLECGDVLSDEILLSGLDDRAEATRTAGLLVAELPAGVSIVSSDG